MNGSGPQQTNSIRLPPLSSLIKGPQQKQNMQPPRSPYRSMTHQYTAVQHLGPPRPMHAPPPHASHHQQQHSHQSHQHHLSAGTIHANQYRPPPPPPPHLPRLQHRQTRVCTAMRWSGRTRCRPTLRPTHRRCQTDTQMASSRWCRDRRSLARQSSGRCRKAARSGSQKRRAG
ncbi:hypothetical protein DL89DRAFT_56902 [Linderina pennispora]|uniref:Uncharacterized protein n=1 Tax=Linderina pennispora TaxID=61395 RepID=A0A1Y1W226_9FUNG|nr:uncharacterized protein DL89DRAFT_56902 [Linderina pennispora]ORX67335.1 hypothetical protein DL89DRAFT_56902 [Linderina pennispora]